jgi:hypothetical protein
MTYLKTRPTFRARQTYVALPVSIDGKTVPALDPEHLRQVCKRDRWCIHIEGEGGLGKTTLARQLALWAAAADPAKRLIEDRRMIPVLLEPSIALDYAKDSATLEETIRGQLQNAAGTREPIPPKLLDRLLRTRRILVIQDGLSENVHAGPSGSRATFDDALFPGNALLITTRTRPAAQYHPNSVIEPLRIDTDHLLPFMNAYLSSAGLALSDPELFEACRRLSEMVAPNRGITPLLASLYANGIIGAQESRDPMRLPETIPDLMLDYISNLNRNRSASHPDNRSLHRAVKIIGWECLMPRFVPGTAEKARIEAHLEREGLSKSHLEYVEKQLNIVRTVGAAELDVQFLIEPIAEYLAGLHAVELCGNDSASWNRLFEDMDGALNEPESIRDWVVALRDCCLARQKQWNLTETLKELERRIAGPARPLEQAAAPAI